ncbi:MAG: hypothetical protein ACKESB_03020 [Candidatus Hodgkinia cicadicola]
MTKKCTFLRFVIDIVDKLETNMCLKILKIITSSTYYSVLNATLS